jgi:hypothetical protein
MCLLGGADYEGIVERTIADAPRFGVDELRIYDDVWIKAHPFYEVNRWLFDLPGMIGFGWHAWKALLLRDTLDHAAPGDIVAYVDGDTYPIRPLAPLYEQADREGAVFFNVIGHGGHQRWCTGDCFAVMGQDEPRYREAEAGCARFLFIKKGDYRAEQLVLEWQAYLLNPYANTRLPGRGTRYAPTDASFVEHRTDQAILTNLVHKYGYPLQPEASHPAAGERQYFVQVHVGRCVPGGKDNNPGTGSRFRNVPLPSEKKR